MEIEKNRLYYESIFENYPDVLNTEMIREMLGNVAYNTVWDLLRYGILKNIYYLNHKYLVPKEWLIDYLLSDHYAKHKQTYKTQV